MNDQLAATQALSLYRRLMLVSGNFFFRFRNAIFPVVIAFVIVFSRPAVFLGNPLIDRIVAGLGVATTLAGQGFRLLVIGFVYIKRGGKDGKIYAKDLVTEGFYAHTRNPMYVGNFLIALGMVMMYGNLKVLVLAVPFVAFAYLSIVTAEEKYLAENFGESYEKYVHTVNRFIPNFRGIRESLRDYRYDWKRALRKDYGTLYWSLVGICAVNIWKSLNVHGFENRRGQIVSLAIAIGIISIGYLIVRYFKMAKKLR